MKTFKNMVSEGSKDEQIKSMLRSADNQLVYDVKERYYGVGDNIDEFVTKLNSLNGETGEFSADLKAAKTMLKAFNKLTIGKYL